MVNVALGNAPLSTCPAGDADGDGGITIDDLIRAVNTRAASAAVRSMGPLRILYTVNRMDVGGSQTHLLQVLRLLDRRRFEPLLCCLTGAGALLDAARETGATVISAGHRAASSRRRRCRRWRAWRGFMRRERIDVVHNYLLRANLVGTVAARAGARAGGADQQARLPRAARLRAGRRPARRTGWPTASPSTPTRCATSCTTTRAARWRRWW